MNYFLDMDLTLVKFPIEHGEKGTKIYKTKKDFFQHLHPYKNIDSINNSANTNTFILTNSPTIDADKSKNIWLDTYLPNIPEERRIFNRGGLTAKLTKAEKVKQYLKRNITKDDVLIDDSITNLLEWEHAGGTGIYKKNRNTNYKWHGKTLSRLTTIANVIAS